MRIAVLSAMEEELIPLLNILESYEEIEYCKNKYYKAKFLNHELILAYSKIGKVNAALTSTILCEKFKADILLFTGVAGSLSDKLHINDTVYATSLVQHDLDITAFGHPHGYVPGNEIFVKTDAKLNDLAKTVAKKLGINLKEAVIATGDEFISKKESKEWIKNTFNADIVEMEGASVAVVCSAFNIPFFVLRSISDNSDDNADISFDEFLDQAAKTSAKFTLEMLREIK